MKVDRVTYPQPLLALIIAELLTRDRTNGPKLRVEHTHPPRQATQNRQCDPANDRISSIVKLGRLHNHLHSHIPVFPRALAVDDVHHALLNILASKRV